MYIFFYKIYIKIHIKSGNFLVDYDNIIFNLHFKP